MKKKGKKMGNGRSAQEHHKLDKELATLQKKLGMKVTGKMAR